MHSTTASATALGAGCSRWSGWARLGLASILVGQVWFAPSELQADGWHNAALATASLDEWLSDLKREVPDIAERLSGTSLRSGRGAEELQSLVERSKNGAAAPGTSRSARGGTINSNLTPQQQALLGRKANDCMEVLAYMDPQNIFPREFPNFQLGKIPEYRKAAKQLLKLMGPAGTAAVVNQVRMELMNSGPRAADCRPTAAYYQDLLAAFKDTAEEGRLSAEDIQSLQEAGAGRKAGPQAEFARLVEDILVKNLSIVSLCRLAEKTGDGNRRKKIFEQIRQRIGTATAEDLLDAARQPELTANVKTSIGAEFGRRLPKFSVVELLGVLTMDVQDSVNQAAAKELAGRSPTYSEIREALPALVTFLDAQDPQTVLLARAQLANAFQRAPMAACLSWLGQGNAPLNKLIWEQIEARLERADDERRSSYATTGLSVLGNPTATIPCRLAAIELLRRTKRQQTVGPVLDLLPTLPRELWPKTGGMLKDVTGQDYGPKPGEGIAEVGAAIKKWRAWWEQNGGK